MASSLTYQTGYLGPIKYQQPEIELKDPLQDIKLDQAKLEVAKKAREASEAARVAAQKAALKDINLSSDVNLWGGDYAALSQAEALLMSDEIMNQLASSPDGQLLYNQLVQQVADAQSMAVDYYNNTWGNADEDGTNSTWNSAYIRSITPNQNPFEKSGFVPQMTWKEAEAVRNSLDQEYAQNVRIDAALGKIVYTDVNGQTVVLGQEQRNKGVFDPRLKDMDVDGYDWYSSSVGGINHQSDQDVKDFVSAATNDPTTDAHRRMMNHYALSKGLTLDDIDKLGKDVYQDHYEAALKMWQDEAIKARQEMARPDREPSEQDKARYNARMSVIRNTAVSGTDYEFTPSDDYVFKALFGDSGAQRYSRKITARSLIVPVNFGKGNSVNIYGDGPNGQDTQYNIEINDIVLDFETGNLIVSGNIPATGGAGSGTPGGPSQIRVNLATTEGQESLRTINAQMEATFRGGLDLRKLLRDLYDGKIVSAGAKKGSGGATQGSKGTQQ
jgi:hypothetical protein